MKFDQLSLAAPIHRAIADAGYHTATPIQAGTIPYVLEGRDVMGCAQTGTGKTAAFALPVLTRLAEAKPAKLARCLVLCPTRELAKQIADNFKTYGQHLSIRGTTIYGGVNQNPQVRALKQGVDVIVATPGRLQDLMSQGHVDLGNIQTLILDEADRMLDMGFIQDIKRIVAALPAKRQTLMFSATLPANIRKLADQLLTDPVTVEVTPEVATVEAIDQSVYFVQKKKKFDLLAHLLENTSTTRTLVFTRTKFSADRVTKQLRKRDLNAEAIHGNKTQKARERALKNFSTGKTHVLIATDIAARGIDVDGISHVINYDLTHEPETYVHRIGRTARAGASGVALSFCDHEEHGHLSAIQRFIRQDLTVLTDCPDHTEPAPAKLTKSKAANGSRRAPGSRNRFAGKRAAGNRPAGKRPAGKRRQTGAGSNSGGTKPRRTQ